MEIWWKISGSCVEQLGTHWKRGSVCFWLDSIHSGHVCQLGNYYVSSCRRSTFKDDWGGLVWWQLYIMTPLQVNLRHTVLFVSALMALGTLLRCGRKFTKLWFSESVNQTVFLVRYSMPPGKGVNLWQFCTTGPGGIGVGYEWDGSHLGHPNPRPTTLAFFGHINTSVPKLNLWKCVVGLDKF